MSSRRMRSSHLVATTVSWWLLQACDGLEANVGFDAPWTEEIENADGHRGTRIGLLCVDGVAQSSLVLTNESEVALEVDLFMPDAEGLLDIEGASFPDVAQPQESFSLLVSTDVAGEYNVNVHAVAEGGSPRWDELLKFDAMGQGDSDGDLHLIFFGCLEREEPSDCDDHDPAVYPGAEEVLGDGKDNDCDATIE